MKVMPPSKYTVELFKGRGKHPFRYRVKARNGEIIAQSEGYTRNASSRRAAKTAYPGAKIIDLTKK